MHLLSREHRAATSGIVGASLPAAAGFALAAKRLRPGAIALAQTGDGALNQGMALESLNLAVAWSLPMLVVCINNGWAITTPEGSVTGGDLQERARAFGWRVESVDGTDVGKVHHTSGKLIEWIRRGKGAGFLYCTCPRMDGHYLGDLLMRAARQPLSEGRETVGKVMGGAFSSGGGGLFARAAGLAKMSGIMMKARAVPRPGSRQDPVVVARKQLKKAGGNPAAIDEEVRREMDDAFAAAREMGHE